MPETTPALASPRRVGRPPRNPPVVAAAEPVAVPAPGGAAAAVLPPPEPKPLPGFTEQDEAAALAALRGTGIRRAPLPQDGLDDSDDDLLEDEPVPSVVAGADPNAPWLTDTADPNRAPAPTPRQPPPVRTHEPPPPAARPAPPVDLPSAIVNRRGAPMPTPSTTFTSQAAVVVQDYRRVDLNALAPSSVVVVAHGMCHIFTFASHMEAHRVGSAFARDSHRTVGDPPFLTAAGRRWHFPKDSIVSFMPIKPTDGVR